MLGKLFNLGAAPGAPGQPQFSSTSKQGSPLESVQEEIHTRSLLFPDAQTLYQHRNDQVFPMSSASALPVSTSVVNPFDLDGEIELESRDVRVIIMQDTSSSSPASLLYDSQPLQLPWTPSQTERPQTAVAGPSQSSLQDARRVPPSQRKASVGPASRPLVIQPGSPQPRQSVFDRRASMHARTQSKAETDSQKVVREYKQEIDTFAGCIFGNNEFLAYKGTSTKVHVVPSDLRNDISSPPLGDGRGSIGRSAMRTSKLSQSFSSEAAVPPFKPSVSSPLPRSSDRKRVLITRLFPVSIPADDTLTGTPRGRFTEDSSEFPFPQTSDEMKAKVKKAQLKQKRTPMYAVALIISLPPGIPQTAPASASRSTFRGSSSYNEQQDFFPSSYNSVRRSGFGGLDAFEPGFNMESEERIDAITRHWDVIMRTLTTLQSTVATEIFSLLKQADVGSPDPLPNTGSPRASRAQSNASQKPPKTNMKFIALFPNCLSENRQVKSEVDAARTRIVSGLRATRVVTGQNRWGIWREEARWVERWAGGRDQGFFFFNLLTGFLSVHTDWLQALGPSKYRKQFTTLQKRKGEDDLSLPARTIIVAQDRVAARRLLFLLSAFLPANQQLPTIRTQRPHTSASFGGFSQSPPSFVIPLTKEESLRRKINRRGTSRHPSHSRTASNYTNSTKSSVPAHLAHLSMEGRHERGASDAASITTTNIPLQCSDFDNRKTSAATTATITQETIIPHFTTQTSDSQLYGSPGSNNSMATDDLKRSLKRDSSLTSSDTQSSSRWGSVISGLWNPKRRESVTTTPPNRNSMSSRDNTPISPRKSVSYRRNSLGRMVEEAASMSPKSHGRKDDVGKRMNVESPQTPRLSQEGEQETAAETSRAPIPVERKPDPSGAFESPVKTTINAEDGVIDVDVPFPDFIASFETAVSSPSSSGYLSTPGLSGLELFEQACRVAIDGDVPMNVAGWLQRYHPDFILQAIPPQNDLIEQVKASLRAEPNPHSSAILEGREERWIDVSSALIADSTDFSIRRIRYRRLVRPKPLERNTPLLSSSVNTMSSAIMTPLISPYEQPLQEEFIEEPIVTLDDTLIEAVERVIAHGSNVSKESSQNSSRSTSKRRESFADLLAAAAASTTIALDPALGASGDSQGGSSTQQSQTRATPPPVPVAQEVPRGECKTVVLSALENIARDVAQSKDDRGVLVRTTPGGHRGREKESVLREAVRAWVEDVEAGMEAVQ
ncbi:hypothetical protein VP1G_04233 [Cytospora mali]|uniref:Folliculin-interacting protein N-terminal domain-containing protein n=1 Tax=Cytospora mali TaxID=578113 RepID=A0A194UYT1_CYTMA|nr:hypothetical protein VP1G_04233 [Valsa mali var. pyri (nom. inval.)]